MYLHPTKRTGESSAAGYSEKIHFQPGFIRWETVTARFNPLWGVLAFFYPVLNIPASVVYPDHLARCKL
jgi:hypothetical protein